MTWFQWAGLAWAAWAAGCAALFLLCALVVRRDEPNFDGFRIRVPEGWRLALTPRELAAVVEHEMAHRRMLHPWANLLFLCLAFRRAPAAMRAAQELAADDAVAEPAMLASALCKMSANPFDLVRARRLNERASRDAIDRVLSSTLRAGCAEQPPQGRSP